MSGEHYKAVHYRAEIPLEDFDETGKLIASKEGGGDPPRLRASGKKKRWCVVISFFLWLTISLAAHLIFLGASLEYLEPGSSIKFYKNLVVDISNYLGYNNLQHLEEHK